MIEATESDADARKNEGHGGHWTAALPSRESNTVEELLRWVCQEGKPAGEAKFDCPQKGGGTCPEKAFGIQYPDLPLRYFLLVVTDSSKDEPSNEVVSGYPYCADGCVNRIRVDKITTWSNGVEGIVHGTMRGGPEVNFFDADFYKNHAIYQTGKAYDFSIAGLAYKLRKATENKMIITEGPAVDFERERVLREDASADISKITSVEMSLEEMRFLICDDQAVDDAEFRTVVEEVGYFEVSGVGYYRLRAVLAWPNDCNFPGYIYAAETLLQGYRPQKGDSIEGWLWLQGRLVAETAHDSVPEIAKAELANLRYFAAARAEEDLAGEPLGVVVVGRTLVQWGGEIQLYEPRGQTTPTFLFTCKQATWQVWVCAQMENEKASDVLSASEQERRVQSAAECGHRAAFAVVEFKDWGHGYRIKMAGLEELQEITGGSGVINYIKKPGLAANKEGQ